MPIFLARSLVLAACLACVFRPVFAADAPPPAQASQAGAPEWVAAMREVHGKFKGEPGTLALFGDSISFSLAFWAPLQGKPKNPTPELAQAWELVKAHQKPACWQQWRGPEFGNLSAKTSQWGLENVDNWLDKLNPEAVVLMFGSNDVMDMKPEACEANLRRIAQRCLDRGTVVILTTIPPRSGKVAETAAFAAMQRNLAKELKLPLVDYHADILRRRPNDWDGSLPQFADTMPVNDKGRKNVYETPTLISGDGVHPSNPKAHQDFSPASLNANGFALRTHLTALVYADVIRQVLK